MKSKRTLSVVCDSGVIIHLDELGLLSLLSDFGRVIATETVSLEVAKHRSISLSYYGITVLPDSFPDRAIVTISQSFCLHQGETAVLSMAKLVPGEKIILTDDTAARIAANHMGFKVHGTIGILLRAVRRKQQTSTEIAETLRALHLHSTLYVSRDIIDYALNELLKYSDGA